MPLTVAPTVLAEKLRSQEPVVLLDVRTAEERAVAVLPQGLWIPLHELPERWREVGPCASSVVVYCHHGIRSWRAAAFLESVGFANVGSLAGGIDAWSCTVDPAVPRY